MDSWMNDAVIREVCRRILEFSSKKGPLRANLNPSIKRKWNPVGHVASDGRRSTCLYLTSPKSRVNWGWDAGCLFGSGIRNQRMRRGQQGREKCPCKVYYWTGYYCGQQDSVLPGRLQRACRLHLRIVTPRVQGWSVCPDPQLPLGAVWVAPGTSRSPAWGHLVTPSCRKSPEAENRFIGHMRGYGQCAQVLTTTLQLGVTEDWEAVALGIQNKCLSSLGDNSTSNGSH